MMKSASTCAVFIRYSFDIKPGSAFIAVEDALLELGIEQENVIINVDDDAEREGDQSAFDLFGTFNIARNGMNEIQFYDPESKAKDTAKFTQHSMVACVNKIGVIAIRTPHFLLAKSDDELRDELMYALTFKGELDQSELFSLKARLDVLYQTKDVPRKKRFGLF